MPTYATVLTTDTWDGFVERQFDRTQANVRSGDMFVIANETAGPVKVPDRCRPLSISEETIRGLGLQILYDRTLFCHNLDYFYIHFYRKNPRYDYYVFLDYPVFIDTDVDALIQRAGQNGIGLIAQPLDVPLSTWVYSKPHASVYPPASLKGTLLPMVVLSNAALAHLTRRRFELSQRYTRHGDFFWPFCEAFVPTELHMAGFKAAALSEYGSVELFSWWPPTLDSTLKADRPEGFIHPLLDRPRYIKTLLQHTKSRELFGRTVLGTLSQHAVSVDYIGPLLLEVARRTRDLVVKRLPLSRKKSALRWGT